MKPLAMILASSLALSAAGETPAPLPVTPAGSFAGFDARARAGERLNVVFFGGSLTWSANATEPNRTGFRGLVGEWLEARYPEAHFRFIDAAIGGTGSLLGVFRLDRDVLAFDPDLVFLDFSCNDGWDNDAPAANLPTLCAYESIARRLAEREIPAFHAFFSFKFWTARILEGEAVEEVHRRLAPYRRIAEAYGGGIGDVYLDSSLLADLRDGKVSTGDVWPIDGGHPDDLGYRYFAEGAKKGFERAVAQGTCAKRPEAPLYGDVADVRRFDPALTPLPDGWSRKLTYRTSLWYDGLPSRWMGDVAAFTGTNRAPLSVHARGNVVAVFGEADENALSCEVRVDGVPLATWRGTHGAGKGRLFIWRSSVLPNWLEEESAEHEFTFDPIPDGTGEFHIGSVCTATLLPARHTATTSASPIQSNGIEAIEALDHSRGTIGK